MAMLRSCFCLLSGCMFFLCFGNCQGLPQLAIYSRSSNGTTLLSCRGQNFECDDRGTCPDNCDSDLYSCSASLVNRSSFQCEHKGLIPFKWQDMLMILILFVVLGVVELPSSDSFITLLIPSQPCVQPLELVGGR